MIALPVGENRMIVASFVWTKHRNVTEDGRTDTIMAYAAVGIASYADGCNSSAVAEKPRCSVGQFSVALG